LVALGPEQGDPVFGLTVKPGDWEAIETFITRHHGRKNLYYSVSEPRADAPDDKLDKMEIGRARAIVADLDLLDGTANTGANVETLAKRLQIATSACPPSLVVHSGGGVQAVWFLTEKLDAETSLKAAEDQGRGIAASLRKSLGDVAKVDNVQDISRIMRLPGTLNVPGAAKRAKGRAPALATCVIPPDVRRYSLEQLAAFAPPLGANASASDHVPAISEAMKRLHERWGETAEVSQDLEDRMGRTRDIPLIELWHDLVDEMPGDGSGSAYRFALAARMHGHGFSLLDYAAVARSSVNTNLEKHPSEAAQQRALARDWVRSEPTSAYKEFGLEPPVPDWVEAFNETHAVVPIGGETLVLCEREDGFDLMPPGQLDLFHRGG
jgi:hypothetical protein